jgi:hypothetical protein
VHEQLYRAVYVMMSMFDRNFNYECEMVTLEKMHFAVRTHLSKYLVTNIRFSEVPPTGDELVYQLTAAVATRTVEKTPASWWQHFKQDCFPKWALKRWPVRYVKTEVVVRFDPDKFDRVVTGGHHYHFSMYGSNILEVTE